MPFNSDSDHMSSTSQSSLDLERIRHFASMSMNELVDHWHLSCTPSSLPENRTSPELILNNKKAHSEDQGTAAEPLDDTGLIPVDSNRNNNKSPIQNTDHISTTNNIEMSSANVASPHAEMPPPPQPAPRRVFRQRQPIQLHPFTEDLKKYHSLIGRKDRFSASGGMTPATSTRRTTSAILQDSSDYSPSYTCLTPSDEEDYDYADSDGFVVDSDVDDLDNMTQTLSVMDTQRSDNNNSISFGVANDDDDDDDDDDAFGRVKFRKRRRLVIMEDSDDDLDGNNNDLDTITATSPTSSSQIDDIFTYPLDKELDRQTKHKTKSAASNRIMQGRSNLDNGGINMDNSTTTTRKSSTQINDIFAYPLEDEELEQQDDHNGKSSAKSLITYSRSKKARKQKRFHKPSIGHKSNITAGGVSNSLTKPSRKDDSIFDLGSLDDEPVQHLDTTLDDADDDTAASSGPLDTYDGFDDVDETSQVSSPSLSTTPQRSSTASIRQTKHGSVRKAAYNDRDDDDDGFIVDDDDYAHEKRRRNTTLREIRKNKRHLQGILPRSFTTTYEKQLEEEENDKRQRSFTIPTKRRPDQDIDDDSASPTTTTGETEYAEIEAAASQDTAHGYRHTMASMDSRRYQEQQRSRFIENFRVDCGVHFLRVDATSVDKLAYLDDEHFSLFRLQERHASLPTDIMDQPFTDNDYYVNSPTITYLFDLAYQSFYGMWINIKNNSIGGIDKSITLELQETNMSRLLGFLRFISMCLSRGYNSNGEGSDGDVTSLYEMQQFLVDEMDVFMDQVLKLVKWQDDTEIVWLKNGKANQGSSSPLLVVLVYFVEWSYQIHKTLMMNPLNISHTLNAPHWTLKKSLRRLLWYLLSLGPSSVSVVPVTSLLFRVAEPRVMEAWVVTMQLIKLENMDDSILWPSLRCFLESTAEKRTFPETDGVTAWDSIEVTWKWVLTVALLQRLQKNDAGYGKVTTTEFYYESERWSPFHQFFRSVLFDQRQNVENLENLSLTDKTQFRLFRFLTLLRLTFCRCHLLLTNYNWVWNALTLQYLYDLVRIPPLMVFTGDPINPQQLYQQQDKVTAAKYFPYFLTTYDGTIPDDEIYRTDTCGVIFLKILSYGSRKYVDLALESSSIDGGGNGSGDYIDTGACENKYRAYLKRCLDRVTPTYLVVCGVSSTGGGGTASSFLLCNLVSNPASILNQSRKVSPFIIFAFDYAINMCILHATSRFGKKNNIGLDILKCYFEFSTKSETEKAFADEISLVASRMIENIKENRGLV
ncbi:hypothetical protein BCR42DRAFT_418121 [Absidia repens]|uniref:Uncharacterized protein n=1 Tax=Absidia repens TaxID=90262 RepID=A0A1X2ICV7_9FUNG|nr:hypothetical protein BCR42DRAFT_418121 [Absidia repens]